MTARMLLAILLGLVGASAHAHAMLDHASPAVGSTVQHAPETVSLWFTEPLESAFSGAEVRNPAGQRVDTGAHVAKSNRAEMQISVKPLPPGTYTVNWHVLSIDTHKTKGSFSFTVAAP